jgi:hypothetical protein
MAQQISGKVYGAVAGAGPAGALTTIIVAILGGFHIEIGSQLATAITTVITCIGAAIGGYLAPHTPSQAPAGPAGGAGPNAGNIVVPGS